MDSTVDLAGDMMDLKIPNLQSFENQHLEVVEIRQGEGVENQHLGDKVVVDIQVDPIEFVVVDTANIQYCMGC